MSENEQWYKNGYIGNLLGVFFAYRRRDQRVLSRLRASVNLEQLLGLVCSVIIIILLVAARNMCSVLIL